MSILAPVYHVLPLTAIERERVLPIDGNVLVKMNQKVNATDVIAEASWSREHKLVDVARALGISPAQADRLLRVKVGDEVSQGSELAVGSGFMPRSVQAPCDGQVVVTGGGQILIAAGDASLELRAGLNGTVVQVIPNRGAVIRTVGALIQGRWGNGRIETGMMVSPIETPDEALTASHMDINLRGSILLGGFIRDAETLRAAGEVSLRGLIVSSISPALLPIAMQMTFPIISIEGFGQIRMNSAASKLLFSNVKREVTINAEAFDRYTGKRPEIIIPLPVAQEPALPLEVDTLAPGQTVWIRRAPYAGAIGTLENLRSGLTALPDGLRAPVAEVRLENGELVLVPLVNLEIVG
ncbi:MAG: hypothetical protein Fur0043_16300 [Anaerolineales bacterium]